MNNRKFHHPFCNKQKGDPNNCSHCDPLYEKHPLKADTIEEAMSECEQIVAEEYPEAIPRTKPKSQE